MLNNYLSVLYKHIIQVENKSVCVGGGGHKHTLAIPPPHPPPPTPPPLPTPVLKKFKAPIFTFGLVLPVRTLQNTMAPKPLSLPW